MAAAALSHETQFVHRPPFCRLDRHGRHVRNGLVRTPVLLLLFLDEFKVLYPLSGEGQVARYAADRYQHLY